MQPVKESPEMSTLADVATYTSKAEDNVECQNYENAEENMSLAREHLEKVSSIDSVLIKSISKKQDHILDLLKVVKSSSKSHQQPSLFPAQFGKEAEETTLGNVNIFGHVDNINDLAKQLAIDCALIPSKVTFQDIVGCDDLKDSIREKIIYRYEFPELYSMNVTNNYQCYLFYGPPGVSKSVASKAIVNEVKQYIKNVYRIKPDVINGQTWKGQTLKVIKALFMMLRENKPSILIIGRYIYTAVNEFKVPIVLSKLSCKFH